MNNRYFILRHGQAVSNVENVVSCWPEKFYNPLTKEGRKQVEKSIKNLLKNLKGEKMNLIFSSDILRAKETAEIVGKELGLKPKYDKRLREYDVGTFNGRKIKDLKEFLPRGLVRLANKPPKGESYEEIRERVLNFLDEISRKYSGKNILIVSHQLPLIFLEGGKKGLSAKEIIKEYLSEGKKRIKNGEWRELAR